MNSNEVLPKDPFILYSFINTRLRDFYPSLDHLCSDMQISKEDLTYELNHFGFTYDETKNQFV